MPANVQTMAYYDEVPWHGLGKEVPMGISAEEMIGAAGLDWKVDLKPARGAREINKKGEFSRYEVLRVPRPGLKEVETLLGVVSRRYRPLQNAEAFKFFDPIVAEGEAYFETAGALGEGERIWVLAKMPDSMEIVRGDECMKYLLLSNSHTGDGSVIVKFTPIRVVCQNTLMLSLKDGQKAYRVRHSGIMKDKLNELSRFVSITQEVFLNAEEQFRRMADIQMIGDRLDHYFDAIYPQSAEQRKKNEKPAKWGYVRKIFESREDLQISGVRGTLWGAYNAITRFEDYKQPLKKELPDQHLDRIWFGGGADVKVKAFEKAKELTGTWG